jgi:hypothetical protein
MAPAPVFPLLQDSTRFEKKEMTGRSVDASTKLHEGKKLTEETIMSFGLPTSA